MSFMRTELEAEPQGPVDELTELHVYVDGEFVCNIMHPSQPAEGQTIEDPVITAVLGDREVVDVSFMGTMVFIRTEDTPTVRQKELEVTKEPVPTDFKAATKSLPRTDPYDKRSPNPKAYESMIHGNAMGTEIQKNE